MRTILIVEDDNGLRLLLSRLLRRAGYECAEAETGAAALKWLESHSADLMLLDYSLPDLVAPEIVAELRQRDRLPPYIVVTSHGGERTVVELMKLGARDYLVKETGLLERLPAAVERALQEVDKEIRLDRAESALRVEQARAEVYFEHAAVMMVVLDRTGRVVRLNRRACETLGWTRGELADADWFERCVAPAVRDEARGLFLRIIAGDAQPVEYLENPVITRGGQERLIAWHLGFLTDEHGNISSILASGDDVTERRRTEAALRESEERWHFALEGPGDGVWDWKLTSNEVFYSRQWKAILGFEDDEIGSTLDEWDSRLHPEDHGRAWAEIRQHLAGRSPAYSSEYRIRCRNGGYKWVLARGKVVERAPDGSPVRMIGTNADITDRKRMEAAVEKRIVALTRPLDRPDGITFEDLFDMAAVQRIQDEFAAATGVASIITRPDGTPLTRPSNFTRLCRDIIRCTEAGRRNCYHSDKVIGRSHAGGPVIQTCLSGGLWDAGTSIEVGERHIANWMIGQVRDETQTEEGVRVYARTIGADEMEAVAAFREVPSMSRKRFEEIAQALHSLVNQLSTSAYQNLQQARFIAERRAAEAALRESEEKFAKAFRNAPVWIAIADLENFRVVDVNEEVLRAVGRTREEVVGRTAAEMGWITETAQTAVAREAREHGRIATREMSFPIGNGSLVLGLVNGERIEIGGRPCLLVAALDVTERKRAEEIIAWEAALVENSSDICCVKDLDLKVRAVNNGFLQMAGLATVADAFGKTDAEIFPRSENRLNVEGFMADERRVQTLGPGEQIQREETIVDPGGTERTLLTRKFPVFDPAGRLIATASIATDVTARRRMEDAVLRSERRYRLLFASNVAGVALHEVVCDAEGRPCDYRFLEVNPAFERLTGLRASDLVGRTVREVMPETESSWIERYGRVALTGDADHFEDFSRALGRHFEISVYSPQRGQFAVLVLDVTERRRTAAALEESLREKEALLKEVHHRVKNNLQVISSLLRLESGKLADPASATVVSNMQERVRAMALLHENLYRSGQFARVDMDAYLAAVGQQLARAAVARSSELVGLDLRLSPLTMEMSQALPCGLLVNELLSNALKHAFPNGRRGRVTVSLAPASAEAGAEWCLCVEDDGVGLPEGFDIRSLRSLGLQLVSDLARQIQGRLVCSSLHGARFEVRFRPTPPQVPTIS